MAREKKITIKPIANTELAAHARTKKYKLYVRVTYDRSSTRFPVISDQPTEYGSNNVFVTEKEVESAIYTGKQAVELVGKIAERERDVLDLESIKALPSIYKIYNFKIVSSIELVMIYKAGKILEDVFTVSQFKRWQEQKIGDFLGAFESIKQYMPDDLVMLIDARQLLLDSGPDVRVFEWIFSYPVREKLIAKWEKQGLDVLKQIRLLDVAVRYLIRHRVV